MITNSAQFNNHQVSQPQLAMPSITQMPVMTNSIDGVALVSSDEAITNYPVTGGATVALIDLTRKLLVLKTNDVYYGKGIYYETYNLTKQNTQPVQNGEEIKSNESEIVSKIQEDIETLKKEYKDIYAMLDGLTAPKKEVI